MSRKQKRKLTSKEKAEKKRRKRKYMTVFMNGKQKRVKRPETIDGMPVDEFILNNADPIWLHQHGMWEYLDSKYCFGGPESHTEIEPRQRPKGEQKSCPPTDGEIPF